METPTSKILPLEDCETLKQYLQDEERCAVIEHQLQKSLPLIAGLEEAASDESRIDVYAKLIARQRARFMLHNKDPLGDVPMQTIETKRLPELFCISPAVA